jgi:hypothetical protein
MKDNQNSQFEFNLNLYKKLLEDVYTECQLPLHEAYRDFSYIEKRYRSEGLGFLTKVLPSLGKSIDLAINGGRFANTSFKYNKKYGVLPRFMRGLLTKVFSHDGTVLNVVDGYALKHLRQLTFLFYKLEADYTQKTLNKAYAEFTHNENVVRRRKFNVQALADLYAASNITNDILSNFDITSCGIHLHNGPGSACHGEQQWERYEPRRFYQDLDDLVPYHIAFFVNDKHIFDRWDQWFTLPTEEISYTTLLDVPKDSRGPRLISKEGFEKMTYQQALRACLYAHLERHPITRGQVNFTDQTINGSLALTSSVTREYATLDAKNASDLVGLDHVDLIFGDTPIYEWLLKSRSSHVKMPDGNLVKLAKYAPMGNALTFPVMALTFWSLLVGRLVSEHKIPLRTAAKKSIYMAMISSYHSGTWMRLSICLKMQVSSLIDRKVAMQGSFASHAAWTPTKV